jgi:hypothetical protein
MPELSARSEQDAEGEDCGAFMGTFRLLEVSSTRLLSLFVIV